MPLFRSNWRRSNAEQVYSLISVRARDPKFYLDYEVPDTVDGRFDLLLLHMFFILYPLQSKGSDAKDFGQALFDVMFANMDVALREMGVGDLSVGKKIKKMAKAFYGRMAAYSDAAGSDDPEILLSALKRNLYRDGDVSDRSLETIATYFRQQVTHISSQPVSGVLLGVVEFLPLAQAASESGGVEEVGAVS